MRLRFFALAVGVLASLALAVAPAASADAAQRFQFSGRFATAAFSAVDASGCVQTDVFVFGGDDPLGSSEPPPAQPPLAAIGVIRSDVCTGTLLSQTIGSAPIAETDVDVDPSLSSARLTTSVEVCDFDLATSSCIAATTRTLLVDVTWTATGEPTREQAQFHEDLRPLFILNFYSTATLVPANAVGSVVDGGTNLTPNPSVSAQIVREAFGEIFVVF